MNSVSHNSGQRRGHKREVCRFPSVMAEVGPQRKGPLPSIQLGAQSPHSGTFRTAAEGGWQPKARPERRWAGVQDPTLLGGITMEASWAEGSADRTSPRQRLRAWTEKSCQFRRACMGPRPLPQDPHMKLLIICLVSSELRELAKLMKEQ